MISDLISPQLLPRNLVPIRLVNVSMQQIFLYIGEEENMSVSNSNQNVVLHSSSRFKSQPQRSAAATAATHRRESHYNHSPIHLARPLAVRPLGCLSPAACLLRERAGEGARVCACRRRTCVCVSRVCMSFCVGSSRAMLVGALSSIEVDHSGPPTRTLRTSSVHLRAI